MNILYIGVVRISDLNERIIPIKLQVAGIIFLFVEGAILIILDLIGMVEWGIPVGVFAILLGVGFLIFMLISLSLRGDSIVVDERDIEIGKKALIHAFLVLLIIQMQLGILSLSPGVYISTSMIFFSLGATLVTYLFSLITQEYS